MVKRHPHTGTLYLYPTTGATYNSSGNYVAATADTVRVLCRVEKNTQRFVDSAGGRVLPYEYTVYLDPVDGMGKTDKRMFEFFDKKMPVIDVVQYQTHWEMLI